MTKRNRQNDEQLHHQSWFDRYYNWILVCAFFIFIIFHLLFPQKKPDYNYDKPYTWKSEDYITPIILEIRLDEVCGAARLSGCDRYEKTQLYLHHITGEVFKCWFSSESDDFSSTDYLGNRRYDGNSIVNTLWGSFKDKGLKIEISEVTFSVARGEKAISKKGLRYCSIKHIKFKHFSDIEHLTLQSVTNGRAYLTEDDKRLYPISLERYKKIFY